tara:strand:+ start:657 stop:1118 length:462 start_codon:yes stop_codon:yes gene_type:complete
MKKIIFLCLVFCFILTSCGFEPIYKFSKNDFYISNINYEGNKSINRTINRSLETYKLNNGGPDYNLTIISIEEKNTSSKDKKGNPKTFNYLISVKISIIQNDKNKYDKNFQENISYNNKDNKFELKKYERNIKINLSEKISKDIIQYLLSLQM